MTGEEKILTMKPQKDSFEFLKELSDMTMQLLEEMVTREMFETSSCMSHGKTTYYIDVKVRVENDTGQ